MAQPSEITASTKAPWSVGANAYYGTLFRYRSGLSVLNFTHPYAVEVYANKHTIGKHNWERQYNHPQVGFALSYYNYGVPVELGEAVSLTTYLDNTLLRFKKSSLRFNLGTGLVYSTRHYTPGVNEQNMAIGSKFTFALRGTVRYEFPIKEHIYLNLNLAFRHFSNGALNKPNNGMNFPLIGVGVRYQPREVRLLDVPDTTAALLDKRLRLNLRLAGGVKEVLRIDEKHPMYSLSVYASKRLSQKSALLFGADGFYNTAVREEFINKSQPVPDEVLDQSLSGVTVGHELHLDKLSFVFQLGRYVHQPYGLYPSYYQRYGLKYSLHQNVSAGVMLLAHTRSAHVIEWGFGLHL
ncbi:acyloxyacyl hydrolase [Pontibacter sp. FD36]|uniref:acyloxyacyl hydrolase n=1 Tax=Pontibacter sp. FD36 TaxID=2789860 RepID=UPI0018AA67FF|nr:acyloxyacyl hydrolase [Pontibacter sp. FD36]MBF8962675.1 acyloxyacyl hydrolase [Pontibacter sp. FD36]